MAECVYVAPSSVEATLQLMAHASGPTQLLAGGTQLLPALRARQIQPAMLIDLRYLEALKCVRMEDRHITLGARTTLAEVERHPLIQQALPLLSKMSRSFATPLVRNSATLGGNCLVAGPVADAIVPLLALDASLTFQSSAGGTKSQSLSTWLAMRPPTTPIGELLTQIRVPVPAENTFWFYYKLGQRKAGATAIASLALLITRQGRRIQQARIAIGAVTAVQRRLTRVEALLRDELLPLDEQMIRRCLVELVEDLPEPRTDLWATAVYRVMMSQALLKKALNQLNMLEK